MPNSNELQQNHDFVMAFEALRKRYGYREMNDAALSDIANDLDLDFGALRICRHLRNAVAHGEPVNRKSLAHHLDLLRPHTTISATTPLGAPEPEPRPEAPQAVPAPRRTPSVAERHAWRIHAWTDDREERLRLANGFIAIGGGEVGDLAGVDDIDTIKELLTLALPEASPRAIAIFAGYWRRFLWDAAAGDLVAMPLRDRTVALGELTGSYFYVAEAEPRTRHRRTVAWSSRVSRDLFSADLVTTLSSKHTVLEFGAPGAVEKLLELSGKGRAA